MIIKTIKKIRSKMIKELRFVLRNKSLIYTIILITIGVIFYILPSSFANLTPVNSIELYSKNTSFENNEPSSWKITKSVKWIGKKEAKITIDVDSILKEEERNLDVIFVLDTSGSMTGKRIESLKRDTVNLTEKILRNKNNRVSLITFDSYSEILSELTNDQDNIIGKLNDLTANWTTNYYQALLNVEKVLKNYEYNENRDCIVLFLTDGYPNEDTPNEVAQYKNLKKLYPYLNINAVQYEMGNKIFDEIKKISDTQYIADTNTLADTLLEAVVTPKTYDKFKIEDYVETDYFYVEEKSISISQGNFNLDMNKQKISWDINNYKTGSQISMTFKIKLKDNLNITNRIFPTNKEIEINSILDSDTEHIISNATPILADNYKVIYEANAPGGCNVTDYPKSVNKSVFETVEISDDKFQCPGYQFKGWTIKSEEAVRINSDYFIMPESDVTIRGNWSKLTINKKSDGTVYEHKTSIMKSVSYRYNKELWKYSGSITKIVIEPELHSIPEAIAEFDISSNGNGGVMAYIVQNQADSTTHTAYIQGDGKIMANANSNYLFCEFYKLEYIEGLSYLDTSNVTSMLDLFYDCRKLKELDLSSFDTSNVTTMENIFCECCELISINLKGFDTSKVHTMKSMFYDCCSLTNLDIANFDTSNVTNMHGMFTDCKNLVTLNVSNFDTHNVTSMRSMFYGCYNLTDVDMANFDTYSVTDTWNMFYGAGYIRTTINVTSSNSFNFVDMFSRAATSSDALITLNYTAAASDIVDSMIGTKASNSHVVKGSLITI